MRAVSLVSIAFGLALAATGQAQAGESTPATATSATATKAAPATKAKSAARSKARSRASKISTRQATVTETSPVKPAVAQAARAAGVVAGTAVTGTAVGETTGSLLGSPGPSTVAPSAPALSPAGQTLAMAPLPGAVSAINPYGFPFPPGIYRCELERSVDVTQVAADLKTAVVQWDKQTYTLHAVGARTGALRYEDAASGLVWLVIAGKSMLLDTKTGKQLANECRI